jgi:BMFP domain-containing protein YqiC
MSDTNEIEDEWTQMVDDMNDAVADSIEQNMEAQAAFMESWADSLENSVPDEDALEEGLEGYSNAFDVWVDATEQVTERATDAAAGEDVDPTEVRDIWLQSANQAFKEVMSTSAFAQANGQLVEVMMQMQEEVDELTQDTVAQMGLPTGDDIEEVGERIVELERRQHAVEEKLDEILEHVED